MISGLFKVLSDGMTIIMVHFLSSIVSRHALVDKLGSRVETIKSIDEKIVV